MSFTKSDICANGSLALSCSVGMINYRSVMV